MKLLPVALALFYRQSSEETLEVWVQTRTDDGPYQGLLEFPGGGIEINETPIQAVVREVAEEVNISIEADHGKFMGIYPNISTKRTVLLYVFLFPDQAQLIDKGFWLKINRENLSRPYEGQIPGPNHRIIDDLFLALYDGKI